MDGIRFASKGEAALYGRARATAAIVLPHVRFYLALLDDDGRALAFTPDLFLPARMEAWEFKGARAVESRDYPVRAAAFRAAFPGIVLRTFRKVRGELKEDTAAPVRTALGQPHGAEE